MDDYLSKPATLEDLRRVLDVFLPGKGSAGSMRPGTEPADELHGGSTAVKPPIDISVLTQLVGGNEELVSGYLRDFPRETAPIAIELRAACQGGQPELAAAAAHKLRSSALTVGAMQLGTICTSLEQAARAGTTESLGELMLHFESELVSVGDFCVGLGTSQP